MAQFEHAIIVTVNAGNYAQSERIVKQITSGLALDGENVSTAVYERDNDGQRVVYLPPEA